MTSNEQLAALVRDLQRRIENIERPTRLDRAAITVDAEGTTMDVRRALLDSPTVPLRAAQSIAAITNVADTLDFLTTVFFGDEEPVISPAAGDLWTPRGTIVLQWTGTVWAEVVDDVLGLALSDYHQTLAPADNRVDVYWTVEPPFAALIGDFWFKIDANNLPYRWDGQQWVALMPIASQSTNYVPGEEGWGFTPDGDAQVKDVTSRGQISGLSGSFDSLEVAGVNILQTLGDSSIGKILSARMGLVSNPALSTTKTKIFELNCGILPGGRTYRVSAAMLLDGAGTLAFTDKITFTFHYTIDGTTPTVSSPSMDGGFNDWYYQIPDYLAVKPEAEVDLATTAPLKVIICAQVVSGAGTYAIYCGSSVKTRPLMTLYDDGPLGARQDSAISQVGGGVSRYTKTFNASWVFGIGATYPATNWFVLGDGEYGIGGQYGLVGFDGAAMVAGLVGSVTPISCTLKWRPRTRKTATGLDVRIVTHNYSSRALAEAAIQYPEGGWSDYPLTAVLNVNNAPLALVSTSLGTGVFAQFKAGTKKGVGFVTQIADTYAQTPDGSGTIYGDGSYECQLVFVYDGTS